MTEPKNHYKLLQVDPQAEVGLIRQAYKYLAEKYNPANDVTGDETKFREISEAWNVLCDESRRAEYDKSLHENKSLKCSFCGKRQNQVKKIIAGPGVYICNECVELTNEIINEEPKFQGNPDKKCSFCGKTQEGSATRRVISGPGVYICSECVDLCNEILKEEQIS